MQSVYHVLLDQLRILECRKRQGLGLIGGISYFVFSWINVGPGGNVRELTPNVGANRPAEAGGVSLARDSGEAAARQAYTACRSGSG